jgi:hypothetical protein
MTNSEYRLDKRTNFDISSILVAQAEEAEASYRMLKEQLKSRKAEIVAGRSTQFESDEIELVSQALEEARRRYKDAIKRLGDFTMCNKIPVDLLPPE